MRGRSGRWYHDDDFEPAEDDRAVLTDEYGQRRWTGSRDQEREDFRGGADAARFERAAPPYEVMRAGRVSRGGRSFLDQYGDVPLREGRSRADALPGPARPAEGGFRGRGPRGYSRSDERIREDVCERLTEDDRIDASDIDVSVADGEVVLSGRVDERSLKYWAEELAARASGVREVINQLRIAAPGPHTRMSRDASAQPESLLRSRGSGRTRSN